MPFQAPTTPALLTLYALGALFATSHAAATPEASPRVLGLDFTKHVPPNSPLTNRLQRRQKTVTADITNAQIAWVAFETIHKDKGKDTNKHALDTSST